MDKKAKMSWVLRNCRFAGLEAQDVYNIYALNDSGMDPRYYQSFVERLADEAWQTARRAVIGRFERQLTGSDDLALSWYSSAIYDDYYAGVKALSENTSDEELDRALVKIRPSESQVAWVPLWEKLKEIKDDIYSGDHDRMMRGIDIIMSLTHNGGDFAEHTSEGGDTKGLMQALNAKFNARDISDWWDKVDPQLRKVINLNRLEQGKPVISQNPDVDESIFHINPRNVRPGMEGFERREETTEMMGEVKERISSFGFDVLYQTEKSVVFEVDGYRFELVREIAFRGGYALLHLSGKKKVQHVYGREDLEMMLDKVSGLRDAITDMDWRGERVPVIQLGGGGRSGVIRYGDLVFLQKWSDPEPYQSRFPGYDYEDTPRGEDDGPGLSLEERTARSWVLRNCRFAGVL
jgi:hypothetical protein